VVPVEELRALARTKLGRLLTFGLEATIDALPDHLRAGERVERLAGAALDFDGLLVLTDHRLLLLASAVRSSSDRRWSIERDAIAGVEADGDALHLRMTDGNTHALTGFTPPDRLAEFHVVLAHGP
jgi:hypothetical protein